MSLQAGSRYLWDFFTVPAWRGNAIYPRLLQAIIAHEAAAHRFWIGHDRSNIASAHGIAKAGFCEAGAVFRLPGGALAMTCSGHSDRAMAASDQFGIALVDHLAAGSASGLLAQNGEDPMAIDQQTGNKAIWDATNYACKENLLRIIRTEAERIFALATPPENWEAPTASGHWQVRDIIGHMADVTEGYLAAFEKARAGKAPDDALGLRIMSSRLDERAQAFRSLSQTEMMDRIRNDFEQMMTVFGGLSADDWLGFTPGHSYMGPIPSFIFVIFHLVDYGVHGWDIREGQGMNTGLTGDTADFLVPIMFILWQNTTEFDKVGGEPVNVGIRVSGRNGGTWRVTISDSGYAYEAGPIDDMPAVLEFDASSLVLTAYGRFNGGTSYGDQAIADKYRTLFHAI